MIDPASTADGGWRFDGLRALYINCTLKRSPELSHTDGLIDISRAIMDKHGVAVTVLRAIDHDIATGVWPDMTGHGWPSDAWPAIYQQVLDADILVLCGPIWLGDNSSVMKRVIERLYACSHLLNQAGQYACYGRVGGRLITGSGVGWRRTMWLEARRPRGQGRGRRSSALTPRVGEHAGCVLGNLKTLVQQRAGQH